MEKKERQIKRIFIPVEIKRAAFASHWTRSTKITEPVDSSISFICIFFALFTFFIYTSMYICLCTYKIYLISESTISEQQIFHKGYVNLKAQIVIDYIIRTRNGSHDDNE